MADIEKDLSKKAKRDAEDAAAEADQASAADPLAKIEWNAMSGSLDFLESESAEAKSAEAVTASNDDARVEKLQALAKSVAKAVSKRKKKKGEPSADDESEIESEVTAAEASAEAGSADGAAAVNAADATAAGADDASVDTDPWLKAEAEMEQMGFQALEEELSAAENDAAAEPTEFIEHDQLLSIIESLLFSTDKPVSVASIKMIFKGSNVRTKDITRALDILASDYANPSRGVSLEEINGGYQLRTKVDNVDFLRRLAKIRPFRLSGPALEVMAIVAYKQPITKHEIDEIRGVESGHLVRALMERGMVNFQGKAEHLPGKPMTYGTTRRFLETFGLRNTRELPTLSEIDDLLPEGIGAEEEEREQLSDLTDKLSNDIVASYSEGEDELLKIKDQLQAIDTTSEFFEQEKVREREKRDRERAQDIRERLMVGEQVDTKDQRWLDRFEAKLQAQEAAAAAGTPMMVSADEMDAAPTVASAVAALTEEADADAEARATSAAAASRGAGAMNEADATPGAGAMANASANDEAEALADLDLALEDETLDDDLTANADWDEDSEGEATT